MDSDASDHMTGNPELFTDIKPCKEKLYVKIADGTQSQVAGIGTIQPTKNLILNSVLFVPKLDCNLLSIQKLTQDYDCVAKFFKNLCEFQDMDSGKTIGCAKECSGLYLLSSMNPPGEQALKVGSPSPRCSYFNTTLPSFNNDAMWHFCFGHPTFCILKSYFPLLFKNKSPNLFQCEICQISKHSRSLFPNQPYKPTRPFTLFHNDVWVPSSVKHVSRSRWFVSFIDIILD